MKTQRQLEIETTIGTINAYCAVVNLYILAIREGIPVEKGTKQADTLAKAWGGINREVDFLRFLRESDHPVE